MSRKYIGKYTEGDQVVCIKSSDRRLIVGEKYRIDWVSSDGNVYETIVDSHPLLFFNDEIDDIFIGIKELRKMKINKIQKLTN